MPLYQYKCPACSTIKRRVVGQFLKDKLPICPKCGVAMTHDAQPPTSDTKETLDNGFMARKVTRYVDAEKLFSERSKKHTKEMEDLKNGTKTLV